MVAVFSGFFVWLLIIVALCLLRGYLRKQKHRYVWRNADESYAEREAYYSTSVVSIHTRSELSSDSDSAFVASVASVNQPLEFKKVRIF